MSDIMDYKIALINTGIFRKVRGSQYRCKYCPFCNDSNFHMYVKIEMDDFTPVQYHCKKCVSGGIMNQKFLDYYGLSQITIPKYKGLKKIIRNKVNNIPNDLFVYDDSVVNIQNYIEYRIGIKPSKSDLQFFQYIGNPIKYANDYLTTNILSDKWFTGDNYRFWFRLTNGNMIGRNQNEKDGWIRFKSERIKDSGIYIIKIPFDPLECINVCISEGIMDSIGLYYHSGVKNGIFISVLGREYVKGIDYVLNSGIFGDNVNIKIFKDSDVNENSIFIDKYKRRFFKHVDIYGNTLSKDFGVNKYEIDISKLKSL